MMEEAIDVSRTLASCLANCSGHGECTNGTCLCEVQFDGASCSELNISYHIAFATVFLLVAAISFVQLLLCIHSEYAQMKNPSLLRACRITTQKLLHFFVCVAAALRGLYFAFPASTEKWSSNLSSAYYPVLLTGASLVVCFWAEVIHLRNMDEGQRFLSKSFLGFLTFNAISYSLLAAELILNNLPSFTEKEKNFFTTVFNGCYAALMLIVVIFFLIYGIQVYFKVQGGFANEAALNIPKASSVQQPRKYFSEEAIEEEVKEFTKLPAVSQALDYSQLNQSRFGLISQAALLTITVGFLLSNILGPLWKQKIPLGGRNTYDIVFRIVELGVALWFPCVLWNCMKPEELWILNPRKILKLHKGGFSAAAASRALIQPNKNSTDYTWEKGPECWICYDNDRTDAGQIIFPCLCKGDVGAVHHECLRRWLIESADNASALSCKVCRAPYHVQKDDHLRWQRLGYALTPRRWLQTGLIIFTMCGSVAGATAVVQLFSSSGIRLLAVGSALLVVYVCCRFLGVNTLVAYQRTKVSGYNIISRRFDTSDTTSVATSQTVTVEVQIR